MGHIANMVLRMLHMGAAVDALDGKTSKAYMGGVGKMLAGASSMFLALAHIFVALVQARGGASYFDIIRGIYSGNVDTALLLSGVALIHDGLADIGNRHAVAVASTPTK